MLILCNIFVELEHSILFNNFEKFHNFICYRINIKLMVCRQFKMCMVMLQVLHIIFNSHWMLEWLLFTHFIYCQYIWWLTLYSSVWNFLKYSSSSLITAELLMMKILLLCYEHSFYWKSYFCVFCWVYELVTLYGTKGAEGFSILTYKTSFLNS